jgi:hypothetical protein
MTPDPHRALPRRLRHLSAAAILGAVLVSGCGGGIVISLGNDGYGGDNPPEVSLVADVAAASTGTPIQLSAAASDDYAVDSVEFLRIDPDNVSTALGRDRSPPWGWDTTMPNAAAFGGSSVRYYARATDDAGQTRNSASVTVRQLP